MNTILNLITISNLNYPLSNYELIKNIINLNKIWKIIVINENKKKDADQSALSQELRIDGELGLLNLQTINIKKLAPKLKSLKIDNIGIEISKLFQIMLNAKNLQKLVLSHPNDILLYELLKEIKILKNLKNLPELGLSFNKLTELPKELGNLVNLKTLDLTLIIIIIELTVYIKNSNSNIIDLLILIYLIKRKRNN
ncbi:hypothetical protein BCR36DRAFT_369435 [Piromyces finnis]|uniref:L domain-like protein n=1 Tax=Piromyces finnis TaxID=1754191 RepID=A0A1Y1VCE3_9FUNG|nr:hypothetical protein BCR36DRAFT_369435 [Piromyces finnis]|eukprot:ORX52643.1 hypothetical protein BCR36DRAFT_369435 [Piromyces finnis]